MGKHICEFLRHDSYMRQVYDHMSADEYMILIYECHIHAVTMQVYDAHMCVWYMIICEQGNMSEIHVYETII